MYNHPITYIPARPGEAKTTLADFSKAAEILGYKPFRNIKEWVQK